MIAGPYMALLISSWNCNLWTFIILLTLPVGPYSPVIFIQSQHTTSHHHQYRQWSTRIVATKQGHARGFLFLPGGHEGVEVFLGIPYASAPLGSLRLMPPVSAAPWTGTKMNGDFPPVCPQVLPWGLTSSSASSSSSLFSEMSNSGGGGGGGVSASASANFTVDEEEALKWMPRGRLAQLKRLFPFLSNQSEDCLFLNIFVPLSVADGRAEGLLPVLVFIHGEDFGYGAGNPYDPSMIVSQGNILAVTLNYRLGILGFLNANSDGYFKSPANFALLDQIAALHWVQENIGAFGGDRGNVTLMGMGKGAAFVNFLMISNALPKELLFHRVIVMSGSALSPLSVGLSNGKDLAKKFATRLKCPTEPPSNMLQCLRQMPLQKFLQSELWRFFGPSDDGVVIEHGIRENILRDKLSHYPMLFGVTRVEILPTLGEHDAVYGLETEKRREVLKQLVDGFYSLHRGEILAAAIHEYTDWERPVQHPISVRDETLDALADAQIVSPLVKVGELHSQGNSQTYFYVFEYQSKISDYTQRLGCVPGEDIIFVFGVPLYISWNDFLLQQQSSLPSSSSSSSGSSSGGEQQSHWDNKIRGGGQLITQVEHQKLGFFTGNFTKNEVQLSITLLHYWANFIRTGNPNAEPIQEGSGSGFFVSSSKGGSSEVAVGGGGGSPAGGGNRYSQSPSPLQQQLTKPKLIDWPPYDTLYKKYLSIEAKPRVRNHYRAHKLSFWLHLVPELMRNGYYNGFPLGSTGGLSSSSTSARANNDNHNLPFNGNSSYPADVSGPLLYPSGRHPYYHDHHHHNEGEGYQIYSTALTVTIAVGCSLLILNILVFAAFYYYRDKRRNSGNVRGRRDAGSSNYDQHHLLHQQHHQQTSSLIGGPSGDVGSGNGPPSEGSLSTMDHLQMQEISAAVAASVAQSHNHPPPCSYVESSTISKQLLATAYSQNTDNSSSNGSGTSSIHPPNMTSSSLQNTPIRFPQQQLKENGQILNLRHHLQQPQLQMLPMPNICGDLSSVPNLQHMLQQTQKQVHGQHQHDPSSANRLPHHNFQPQPQQQHHHHQQQQQQQQHFFQYQQQLPQHYQLNPNSTLPSTGQLPRKHQKEASNVNLTNLDFSTMPDAILAAAMMLNYRQQPPSSSASLQNKSATAPRKSALNMKEQLLISAGLVSGGGGSGTGGGGASVNLVGIGGGTLGRTSCANIGVSGSGSPSLGGSIIPSQSNTMKQHHPHPPGTNLISGAIMSSGPPPSAANVIQFELESNQGSGNVPVKNAPRPPKRHTPTVKFSPETFASNSAGGGGGETGNIANPDSSASSLAPNLTLSSVVSGSAGVGVNVVSTTTTTSSSTPITNVTPINQAPSTGGQALKSSLKKNSSYSNAPPPTTANPTNDELKV